jgi:hypothetical protein
MWPGLVDWSKTTMLSADPPLAGAEDLAIPRCVPNADAAIALIREHHKDWLRTEIATAISGPADSLQSGER